MSRSTTQRCRPSPFALDQPAPTSACLLSCPALGLPGIAHGFATRRGWDAQGRASEVNFGPDQHAALREAALEGLCNRMEMARDRLFTVHQVHGERVIEVSARASPSDVCRTEADALITALPGTTVAVRTADCVPILVADPVKHVVAAVHAGWRGALAGIIERTVERMVASHGCRDSDLVAAIGPAIGLRAFETGPDVADQFAHLEGVVQPPSAARKPPHVDLKLAAYRLLQRCGVVEVSISDNCTFEQGDLFHSYRRDGQAAGRQSSAIGLRKKVKGVYIGVITR